MRARTFLMLVTGCIVGPEIEPADEEPELTYEQYCGGGGGLPTRSCGTECTCCVGCDVASGTCMSLRGSFTLGVGECYGISTGTLTMLVDGVAFAATQVAAVADEAEVNVGGSVGASGFSMLVPAQLGTFDCATDEPAAFVYSDGTAEYWNRPTSRRPACSVTLTAVGAIGERIEGTFAISLLGANRLDLSAGSFSVVRRAY